VQVMPTCVIEALLPPAVIVPLRDVVDVFAAAVNETDPLPVPLAPAVIVIHVSVVVAVHEHPAGDVTVSVPEPPPTATACDAGDSVEVHGTPACVTVKVLPATVSVPVRDVPAVFAATLNVTLPLPEPDAPVVTVIHASLLTAVHAHPVGAVTVVLPVPPPATTDWLAGEIVSVQVMPTCVIVALLPPALIVPLRDDVEVFAAALNEMDPLPVPLAPAVIVIHASVVVAVHEQPVGAVTPTVPDPPPTTTACVAGESVEVQGTPACVTVNVLPATVSVPVRDVPAVFAAMLNVTLPLPEPVAPAVTVIHGALLT